MSSYVSSYASSNASSECSVYASCEDEQTKRCSMCKIFKPLDEFKPAKNDKNKKSVFCNDCLPIQKQKALNGQRKVKETAVKEVTKDSNVLNDMEKKHKLDMTMKDDELNMIKKNHGEDINDLIDKFVNILLTIKESLKKN